MSRAWIGIAAAAGAVALLLLLVWLFSPAASGGGKASAGVLEKAVPARGKAPARATGYAFRSTVPGASFVRLGQLPTATPYGDISEHCSELIQAATTLGGRLAEQRGWRVVEEKRFHGLDAVLVVRGFEEGTSSHCFSRDPNVAFFQGDRLVGVLYSRGPDGFGMNALENVGRHLRVWGDLSPVGQFNLDGTDLTFDPVTGSDEVCGGRYRVPAVFNRDYASARPILRRSGWVPRPRTEESAERIRAPWLAPFPEVDDCSGTGYGFCGFDWVSERGDARLAIITAGGADDPMVISYGVSCDGRQD